MYHAREEGGQLVPVSEIPEEAMRAIERYDDEAIAQRLVTGIASGVFIYSYPIKTATGTKQIIGISTVGADEIALMLGNIEVLPDVRVDKDSDPDYIYGMVRARDVARNVTLLGVGRHCKYQIGKGNVPDHDRINEHAFVACISKGQRNAILHLTSEEIIIKAIDTFEKRGKLGRIAPPTLEVEETPPQPHGPARPITPTVIESPTAVTPPSTVTEEAIADQQEKLKQLRLQVHNKFQTDLGIGVEKRKEMLGGKFGVSSLTDLSEQQLRECLSWVEEMIQQRTAKPGVAAPSAAPPTNTEVRAKELGFESSSEQNQLRGRLYSVLTSPNQLNLKDEEAKKFITDRGIISTSEISKTGILELIKEANELVKAKQTPPEF